MLIMCEAVQSDIKTRVWLETPPLICNIRRHSQATWCGVMQKYVHQPLAYILAAWIKKPRGAVFFWATQLWALKMETQADRDTLVTLTATLQGWLLELWEDMEHRLPEYSRDIITYV